MSTKPAVIIVRSSSCETVIFPVKFAAAVSQVYRQASEDEARRRGISIEEAYQDELAAKAELAKITPRTADLLKIADRFPAPQTWYDE